MNNRTLLLVRSYGDFIVAICSYNRYSHTDDNTKWVASLHLKPIYDSLRALQQGIRLPDIEFIDWQIRHQILGVFTNRFFFSFNSFAECRHLRTFFKHNPGIANKVWLEQKKRQKLFDLLTAITSQYVHDGVVNIYDSYAHFWGAVPQKVPGHYEIANLQKILVLPGSRKAKKRLPQQLISQIVSRAAETEVKVTIAGLKHEMEAYEGNIQLFSSFEELISIIREYDCIHCADSVAAHICELLQKPHKVYYTKAVNLPWVTPGGHPLVI